MSTENQHRKLGTCQCKLHQLTNGNLYNKGINFIKWPSVVTSTSFSSEQHLTFSSGFLFKFLTKFILKVRSLNVGLTKC